MRSLEELKLVDDGGSFDRLVEKMEEVANGDESLKLKLLTESVLKDFIDMHFREAKRRKLLAFEEKETNCGVEFFIPKKIRSKGPPPDVSRIESNNKSIMERCYLGVVEGEGKGKIVKKPAVKNTSKAGSLEKKRRADSCLEEEEERKKKKRTIIRKNNLDDQLGLNPPPDLPQEFKDQIERLKGTNVALVAQKELTQSDMNAHQSRLSIPSGQVRNHDFLSEEEIRISSTELGGIPCSLIQPCLEEIKNLKFRKWDLTTTFIYTLIKKWKLVAYNTKNQLEVGSKVQLWSFRVGSDLWFAMVKLKQEEDIE